MSNSHDSARKATVEDLAAELRLLNEKADRFEQYLRHVSDEKVRSKAAWKNVFWASLVVLFLVVAASAFTATIVSEQERGLWALNGKPDAIDMLIAIRDQTRAMNWAIGSALALAGIAFGLAKSRA